MQHHLKASVRYASAFHGTNPTIHCFSSRMHNISGSDVMELHKGITPPYHQNASKWFHTCLGAQAEQFWFGCKAPGERILRVFNRRATLQTTKSARLGDERLV